jgi:hypothetical protein
MLFLVLVSNAKYHALREPFIFQDFEYFSDVFRHPRLYLPFLGAGKAALAVLAFGGAVYAGLALEESLLSVLPADDFLDRIGDAGACCRCSPVVGRAEQAGGDFRSGRRPVPAGPALRHVALRRGGVAALPAAFAVSTAGQRRLDESHERHERHRRRTRAPGRRAERIILRSAAAVRGNPQRGPARV